eukprot:1821896-Pyramimonas_sp.AAC.1
MRTRHHGSRDWCPHTCVRACVHARGRGVAGGAHSSTVFVPVARPPQRYAYHWPNSLRPADLN